MDVSVVTAAAAVGVSLVGTVFTYRGSVKAANINARAGELGWVKEIRQDAIDSRRELDAAEERFNRRVAEFEEKVRDLTRRLDVAIREADLWATRHVLAQRIAFRPGATVADIQEALGPPPPDYQLNGSSHA